MKIHQQSPNFRIPGVGRMTAIAAALISATGLMLSGCSEMAISNQDSTATTSAAASHTSKALPVSVSAQPLNLAGEQAIQLEASSWISADPKRSLSLVLRDNAEQHQLMYPEPVEYLDVRQTETGHVAVSLNHNNQLVLTTIENNSATEVAVSQSLPWALEGLCLYQPPREPLQLFALDEEAVAHQLLLTSNGKQLSAPVIRSFSLPPGTEYCAVDDVTESLFVSEEGIGIWAYNARAESQVQRVPVDLVAPWGQLAENAGPLAVVDNTLLAGEKDGDILHQYQIEATPDGSSTQHVASYAIANTVIDGLQASAINKQITAVVLNDETGQLESLSIARPAQSHQRESMAYIPASAETDAVKTPGDAADDPAIWVHPTRPEASLILGTNKKQGLYSYDLQGKTRQFLEVGRVNNVDLRQGFSMKGKPADIAAASQRDRKAISLFQIDPGSGHMTTAGEVVTSLNDVYGLCMYQSAQKDVFVFINDKDGRYEQYQILDTGKGWQGKRVRTFAVETQPEGCAADDRAGNLFVGEEGRGIWLIGADANDGDQLTLVTELGQPSAEHLFADVEGLDVYQTDTENLLVVSSQGNDSYLVYNADAPYDYIGRFRVGLNARLGIDGASETDGLTVRSAYLGEQYPQGLLVVQDGRNLMPNDLQNFKLVDWRDVEAVLKTDRK